MATAKTLVAPELLHSVLLMPPDWEITGAIYNQLTRTIELQVTGPTVDPGKSGVVRGLFTQHIHQNGGVGVDAEWVPTE